MKDWSLRSGERQVAPDLGSIRSDHVARYQLATRWVASAANVLDVFCGVGYGSRLLLEAAPLSRRVLGLDGSPEALWYAHRHYQTERLTFFRWVFPEERQSYRGQFDAIVCLESLEHVEDAAGFLALLARWSQPGATLVLSTPNEDAVPFTPQSFPHHIRHFKAETLRQLLLPWWTFIDWQYQSREGQFSAKSDRFHVVVARRKS